MKVIDIHNHIGMSREGTLGTVEELLQNMDNCKIDHSILFTIDVKECGDTYEVANDIVLDWCKKYPDKLSGLCRVQPKRTKPALKEFERCMANGMIGLKLHPFSDNFFIEDCMDVFKMADDYKCPIILHSEHHTTRRPSYWEGAFKKFRNCTFVLAHAGKDLFFEAGDMAKQHPNVYLDTSCLSLNRTKELLKIAGPEKIMMASDYPYSHPELEKRKLELIILKESDLELVMYKNAEQVFGLI